MQKKTYLLMMIAAVGGTYLWARSRIGPAEKAGKKIDKAVSAVEDALQDVNTKVYAARDAA